MTTPNEAVKAFFDAVSSSVDELIPADLKAKGWRYKDIPWIEKSLWDRALVVLGEGNYKVLEMSENQLTLQCRGQIIYSPDGIERSGKFLRDLADGVHSRQKKKTLFEWSEDGVRSVYAVMEMQGRPVELDTLKAILNLTKESVDMFVRDLLVRFCVGFLDIADRVEALETANDVVDKFISLVGTQSTGGLKK